MNEEKTPEVILQTPKPEQPKRNSKKILVIITIVLLATALGALTYLYINEKSTSKDLSQKVSQLENEHSDANSDSLTNEGATLAEGSVNYDAEVGKFSLSLPNNYRIVEYIDGAGEGGELTSIEIGKKSDKGESIVNNSYFDKLEIWAAPADSYGSLQVFIDSRIQVAESTREADTTIDGIEAQVYSVPGIDVSTYYFFENNGVVYMISSNSEDKANSVINGFSFKS